MTTKYGENVIQRYQRKTQETQRNLNQMNEELEKTQNQTFEEKSYILKKENFSLKLKYIAIKNEFATNNMNQNELEIERWNFENSLLISTKNEQVKQLEMADTELIYNNNLYHSMRHKVIQDNNKQIEKTWNDLNDKEMNEFRANFKFKMNKLQKESNNLDIKRMNFIKNNKVIEQKIVNLKQMNVNKMRENQNIINKLESVRNEIRKYTKTIGQLNDTKMEYKKYREKLNQYNDDLYPDDDEDDEDDDIDDDMDDNNDLMVIDLTLSQTQQTPINRKKSSFSKAKQFMDDQEALQQIADSNWSQEPF